MAKTVQFRGGTTTQHSTFTGANREITIDTDKHVPVVHDGVTPGGYPLALASASVKPDSMTVQESKDAVYQAHLSKDAIGKIKGLQSSASEIDNVAEFFNNIYVTPEMFGADGTRANDSIAIRSAINTGKILKLAKKRYYYDGTAIKNDFVAIEGSVMPKFNDGYTSLEGGSIIDGMLFCSGKNVYLQDFGVDVGSDTSAIDNDGLKCTTTLNSGKKLYIRNVIALLKSNTTPRHAILLESFQDVYCDNLHSVYGYFGIVVKCRNVVMSNLSSKDTKEDGLYIKSDDNFGTSSNITINGIKVDGKTTQANGIRVQSATAITSNVNIANIDVKDCITNILIQSLSNPVNNIVLSGKSINPINRSVYVSGNTKGINGIDISGLITEDCNNTGIEFAGVCTNVVANDINIKYKDTVTAVELGRGIIVGGQVLDTSFDNIKIGNTNELGSIVYNNTPGSNTIGYYKCKTSGGAKPQEGYSFVILSGTTAALSPIYNHRGNNIIVKVTPSTSPTNITSISKYKYGTTLFDPGTILTVLNSGSNPLYVNHNFGGNVVNDSSVNKLINPNASAQWAFGGAVWQQIV